MKTIRISRAGQPGRRARLYDPALRAYIARERGVRTSKISVGHCLVGYLAEPTQRQVSA